MFTDIEQEIMDEVEEVKVEENVCLDQKKDVENIHIRAPPKLFINMVLGFSEAQKNWVKEAGFGKLANFNIGLLPYRLGYRVASSFNPCGMKLEVESGEIVVGEEDVKEVLGLPLGEKKIELRHKIDTIESLWKDQFPNVDQHKVTTKHVLKKMSESGSVDTLFKLNFLVMLTNVFIKSNTSAFVNKQILRFGGELDECGGYNWCELVLDSLIECTPLWKKDPGSRFYTGPLIFLIVSEVLLNMFLMTLFQLQDTAL